MPYADLKTKREMDRTTRKAQRRQSKALLLLDDPREFARWFSKMDKELNSLLGGRKSPSNRLADEMGMAHGYGAHLRKIARSKRKPYPETAYAIGEGFRACGIPWCNGLLALLHADRLASYSVLDLMYADSALQDQVVQWFLWSNTVMSDYPPIYTWARANLADTNQRLETPLKKAWRDYCKAGKLRRAHGMLGLAVRILQDPCSGPDARVAFETLVEKWHNSFAVGVSVPFLPKIR